MMRAFGRHCCGNGGVYLGWGYHRGETVGTRSTDVCSTTAPWSSVKLWRTTVMKFSMSASQTAGTCSLPLPKTLQLRWGYSISSARGVFVYLQQQEQARNLCPSLWISYNCWYILCQFVVDLAGGISNNSKIHQGLPWAAGLGLHSVLLLQQKRHHASSFKCQNNWFYGQKRLCSYSVPHA